MVYATSLASAKRIIRKKGRPVIWRHIEEDNTSPTPWKGSALTTTDFTVDIVFLPVDRTDHDNQLYRERSDKPIGFENGYMAGDVPFEPTLKDVVLVDGKELHVDQITLYSPNGEKILYDVRFLL